MEKQSTKIVLVTGASGYIASHTIKLLLQNNYRVRGTVRSLSNTSKYNFLKEFKNSQNLQLVEGDLTNEQCWDKIVEGCDQVLHIASPIPPYVPKHEDDIIIPAVNGTKFVLNAAIRHKVKRLVFTSSCLTILIGNDHHPILNETMWSDVTKTSHYPKSKILAERALWDIYNQQNLKQPHTQVVSLLVAMVVGPGYTIHSNSSQGLVQQLLRGTYPGIPEPAFNATTVDVRDVAVAHLRALQKNGVSGERIAIASRIFPLQQICTTIKQNFPKSNVKLQKVTPQQIKASGNQVAMRSLGLLGKKFVVDNTKSKKLLDLEYTDLKQSIIDMSNQHVKLGLVKFE